MAQLLGKEDTRTARCGEFTAKVIGKIHGSIPISAQVVSVADVYDALASERVYKKAVPHEKVLEMILHGECGQFNPILIECLQEISSRIRSECYDEE